MCTSKCVSGVDNKDKHVLKMKGLIPLLKMKEITLPMLFSEILVLGNFQVPLLSLRCGKSFCNIN